MFIFYYEIKSAYFEYADTYKVMDDTINNQTNYHLHVAPLL